MIIYIVMADMDGMMRSTCDTPVAAFVNKRLAEVFIKTNKDSHYALEIKEVYLNQLEVK